MEMMTSTSCGAPSKSSDKSYPTPDLVTTSKIIDHDNNTWNGDLDVDHNVVTQKDSKVLQFRHLSFATEDSLTAECVQPMGSDVRCSAGYRKAWTDLNAQLVTLIRGGIFQQELTISFPVYCVKRNLFRSGDF